MVRSIADFFVETRIRRLHRKPHRSPSGTQSRMRVALSWAGDCPLKRFVAARDAKGGAKEGFCEKCRKTPELAHGCDEGSMYGVTMDSICIAVNRGLLHVPLP